METDEGDQSARTNKEEEIRDRVPTVVETDEDDQSARTNKEEEVKD